MPGLARVVYLLYGLSGFLSLSYQVVWFRLFIDRFGSTNLTFALVVCNFIGGLGAGALASHGLLRRARGILGRRSPLGTYGIIELLVSATVAATLALRWLPADLGTGFPYRVDPQGILRLTAGYRISTVLIATAVVFVPCFLMGLTFPLLCRTFQSDGRFPSALYAWNTLGACTGVLACEFLFLPWVGHDRTLLYMIGLNLALGGFFALWNPAAPGAAADAPSPSAEPRPGGALPVSAVLAGVVVSGLLSGALEGDMFKRLRLTGCRTDVGMSFISFWAILAIFLGSWTVRAVRRLRFLHVKLAFAAAFVCYLAVWRMAYPLRDFIDRRYAADTATDAAAFASAYALQSGLVGVLAYVGVFVFPTYYLISLVLPYLCNRVQADRRPLGLVYGLNTLAFCAGLVTFTWIAPRVNVFYSLKLLVAWFAVLALLLLLVSDRRPLEIWKPAVALLLLAGCSVWVPAGFDPDYLAEDNPARRYPVRAMKSNGAFTTYVVADPIGDRLFFDSHSMSGTSEGSQRYMRLMAHFPLLAHAEPRAALLICFGVGNTASAIATHESIERIDVVELNDRVFETAPEFAKTNGGVYSDPRVTLIHGDGRQFLESTDRTYDLVTSEPPPPMHEGVYRLYSREYYESVIPRLTPQGMMTQWLPVRQLPREASERIVSTFIGAFPHALLFVGHDDQLILVGSRAPIDLRNIERRFSRSPAVAQDLLRIGVARPAQLLARIIKGGDALLAEYGSRPTISDQRNDLAHLFVDVSRPSVVTYEPVSMLEDIDARRLESHAALRALVTDLARLRAAVPDFPLSSLLTVRETRGTEIAFAHADWAQIDRLNVAAVRAGEQGEPRAAVTLFRQSLALADGQLSVWAATAQIQMQLGDFPAAEASWRRYLELDPDEGQAHHHLGRTLSELGRTDEAIAELRRAIDLMPASALPPKVLGDVLARAGRWAEAIASYDHALSLDASYTGAHRNREQARRQMK